MISPVEILSYDPRPADFSPQRLELEGPSFGEYLARAEEERGGISVQQEAEREDRGPQTETAVQSNNKENKTAEADAVSSQAQEQKNSSSVDEDAARSGDSPGNMEESVSEKKNDENDKTSRTEATEKGNRKNGLNTAKLESEKIPVPETEENGSTLYAVHNDKQSLKDTAPINQDPSHVISETAPGQTETDVGKVENNTLKGGNFDVSDFPVTEDAGTSGKVSAALVEEAQKQSRKKEEVSEESSRLRGTDKDGIENRQTVKTELIDLRRQKIQKNEQASDGTVRQIDSSGVQDTAKPENSGRQEFLVLETVQAKSDGNLLRGDSRTASAAADLSRALKEEGNSEILRKAQFVLKDRDQGEIRLILKPEKLGEVRIRLNLSDNRHIAGRIIVENNSVREVFQENMEALNRAFRDSGFQTAGLDVSVGQREGFSGRRRERDLEGVPVEKLTRIFDEQMPRVEDYIFGDSRVNVYV